MSYFDEMIAREHIPDSCEHWATYRQMVTDYIERNCPDKRNGDGRKPVLALWGIGQAGDIDIGRLAAGYKLVLIDRDEQAVREAAQVYGLTESEYVIADIPFWRVDDDQYRLFDALLEDGADLDHILEFLEGIARQNSGKYIGKTLLETFDFDADRYLDIFDYSVAVGLHSQLNSRFAALLYHYRENYHDEDLRLISSAISGLNESAVEKLNDYMYHTTLERQIYGYEVYAVTDYTEAGRIAERLNAGDMETMKSASHIEGVGQLMKDISLHRGCDVDIVDNKYMVWPFDTVSGKKNYVMGFVTMEKIR